jgi:hypothetical protein
MAYPVSHRLMCPFCMWNPMAPGALCVKCRLTNSESWSNPGRVVFSKKVCGSNSEMLDEYALVPDIFDPAAYSDPNFIGVLLPHLREPIFQDALVRDLCDGGWSQFCLQHSGSLHNLCKEFLRKLSTGNRLHRVPRVSAAGPACAADWCKEGIIRRLPNR